MHSWEILYEYDPKHPHSAGLVTIRPTTHAKQRGMNSATTKRGVVAHFSARGISRALGFTLVAISLGGMIGPVTPEIRMESAYLLSQAKAQLSTIYPLRSTISPTALPASAPVVFDPLVTPDGASIDPINTEFSVVIPKIGVNAAVAANVDPANADEYLEALKVGVAHANSSFLPDQDGTTYLFSHSTNFDWFVKDLNAVFYLLKNLEKDDKIVLFYKGKRYTYTLTDKKVVSPKDVSYLVPETGTKKLILQTCWPPGSITQRLLIFADLVEDQGVSL